MAANLGYIREVSDIRYGLKTSIMIRAKDKNKAKAKGQAEMALNCKAIK